MDHTGRLAAMLAFGLALALVGGCGSSSKEQPSAAPAASADVAFPRTIEHHKGTTRIERKPERIVALDNSLVEAIVLLNARWWAGSRAIAT